MQRIVVLSMAVALLAAGCADARKPAAPTEPERAALAPSFSTTDGGTAPRSTLCVAYAKARDDAKAQLAQNPQDAEAAADVASYDAVLANSCS